MGKRPGPLRRLVALPAHERRLVVGAWFLLAWTVVLLRFSQPQIEGGPAPERTPRGDPREVARAIGRAAPYVPTRPTCLPQALAARTILRRRGHDARLAIGAARDASGAFLAHAWVEVNGEVIMGGRSSDERYARFAERRGASL